MVSLTMKHSVRWQAPMPLWAESSSTGLRIKDTGIAPQPSILRFATDAFMEEMLLMLNDNPKRIVEWVAQPETWREPMKSPQKLSKPQEESSIAYLFNKTKQQTDQQKPAPNKLKAKPKGNVVIPVDEAEQSMPLKLFQAAHKRYYLVSASLINRNPGMPDHQLNLSKNEKVSFVVRRLVPPEDDPDKQNLDNIDAWDEFAFVQTDSGNTWKKLDQYNKGITRTLASNEEQLPLFPVTYQDSCGYDRKVHSGLIPVGRRETWMAASASELVETGPEGISYAKIIFQTDVTAPWKVLVSQAQAKQDSLSDSDKSGEEAKVENDRVRRTARDNIQTVSWYILLDLANFLEQYLPTVWTVINKNTAQETLDDKETQFLNTLESITLSDPVKEKLVLLPEIYVKDGLDCSSFSVPYCRDNVKSNFLDALVEIKDWEENLESVEDEFVRYNDDDPIQVNVKWPDFLFPLADPQHPGPLPPQIEGINYSNLSNVDLSHAKIDALAELIEKMLPAPSETEVIFNSQAVLDQRDAWFVVRCVYERPLCGPLFPALVSHPTRPFQLAAFFDSDAPARPIRIPMPVDISPAGLRKFQKNTAFVISDMLCGKIKKIRKLTLGDLVLSVLPWPFHKDLPNPGDTGPCKNGESSFGVICSLSIPIVTLCALILVMIMVALFDVFFRWIPFFIFCLPIPGFKGKKGS